MPPDPSAKRERSRARPPSQSWGPVRCSGAARPARFRCPQTPSAKHERSRARPPWLTLLVNEGPPAPGTDPAHVGGERIHVRFGDEVLVGRHFDRLAPEEAAADRVLGDARELALRDPGP